MISRLSQQVGKRKAGRKERVADIRLLPPTSGGTAPLPVQVASEPEPPEGAKPRLTTVAVSSVEIRIWYALMRRIARSGCEVEEAAARLERAAVVAS